MSKDYLTLPPTQMRRSDRAVEDEAWIHNLLKRAAVGYLATAFQDQPFINSNLFVYDEPRHVIYMHTALVGRTPANAKANPLVCFSVTEMGRLLPAEEALEFSVEYSSVIAFGRATLLEDAEEKIHGLQLLLGKYAPHLRPGEHYRPMTDEELKRTAVYRIEIDSWSGKMKKVAEDFPGAFFYDETAAP